jgi:EmrB/QacA subfamily drug resistance transporter
MTTSPEPSPQRWQALSVCLVAGFMCLLDVTIVNVALPSIQDALHAPLSALQWVLSGYSLAFGMTLVPAGRFGDSISRRNVFIIGALGFTVASALCGAAQSSTWLVLGRLMQGAAAGTLLPQVTALIQQLFSGRERGTAFGLFSASIGVSMAAGPILGGAVIELGGLANGWRWIFLINLPIGLAVAVFSRLLLPAHARRRRNDFDPLGVVLFAGAVGVLLLATIEWQRLSQAVKWPLLGLAAVLAAVFVVWERRYLAARRAPLLNLGLFENRGYTLGTALGSLYFAGGTSILFLLPLYLQSGRGYSALAAGLSMSPFAIGSAASAIVAGRLAHRLGAGLIGGGLALVILGVAGSIAVLSAAGGTPWAVSLPLVLAGVGNGLIIAPNQTLTLAAVPIAHAGAASAMVQVGQRVCSAIGIAVIGAVFFDQRLHAGWITAYRWGLLTIGMFVLAALAVAVSQLRPPSSGTDKLAELPNGYEDELAR